MDLRDIVQKTMLRMKDENWPARNFSTEARQEAAIWEAMLEAMAKERETCAQLVDELTVTARDMEWSGHYCAEVAAIKIRKRAGVNHER